MGHALTGAFSGGNSASSEQQPVAQQQQPERNPQNPCEMEMKQFLECANQQSDITLCQGFNEALKQCKMYYQATSKQFELYRWIFYDIICLHFVSNCLLRLGQMSTLHYNSF